MFLRRYADFYVAARPRATLNSHFFHPLRKTPQFVSFNLYRHDDRLFSQPLPRRSIRPPPSRISQPPHLFGLACHSPLAFAPNMSASSRLRAKWASDRRGCHNDQVTLPCPNFFAKPGALVRHPHAVGRSSAPISALASACSFRSFGWRKSCSSRACGALIVGYPRLFR